MKSNKANDVGETRNMEPLRQQKHNSRSKYKSLINSTEIPKPYSESFAKSVNSERGIRFSPNRIRFLVSVFVFVFVFVLGRLNKILLLRVCYYEQSVLSFICPIFTRSRVRSTRMLFLQRFLQLF